MSTMGTFCQVELCSFESFIQHPDMIKRLDEILHVGFSDGPKHLFSDFLTASFDKKPDLTAIFYKNRQIVGMGTLFINGNQIILENLCVKFPKNGDFAYCLKALIEEIVFGNQNLCDMMYVLNSSKNISDNFYIVSYVDCESGNCENLKAINTMCQVKDNYVCNYLTKKDGYSKRSFPNLKMEWEPEYYDYAFVVHVKEGEIVPRLEKHIDSETRALLAMHSTTTSSRTSEKKTGKRKKMVNSRYSMPPGSPSRNSVIPKSARSTPMSTRGTPQKSSENKDARNRTPNGRFTSSPGNRKRPSVPNTPNTPNTPNAPNTPNTRGSGKKKSRR